MTKKRGINIIKHPRIHLYIGNGEGKTTNAFGLVLRAIGHGKKAVIIQFLKGRKNIGEYMVRRKLGKGLAKLYNIHQFGRKEFIDLKNPKKKDFELAKKGFEFAEKIITKNNKNNKNDKRNAPDLLVLDELALASAYGLIDVNLILKFLKRVPIKTTVIITGRKTPKELIKAADLVTEMKCIKHPYQKGEKAKKGIEF
ncbi:cob(I)yrinic acid a,c-diamide adenosyltransferase [Candidatus Woesearchaeota archaeon]|nr:cob(I)yrinic acid a,c-diamide adenosyltransferase [Candidatus Woesearchaeota archaeon]